MIISSTACEIQQSCLCYCFHEFFSVRHGTLQFECLKLFFANFFFREIIIRFRELYLLTEKSPTAAIFL